MKVAPSIKALPAGSSDFCRWSGRMPYLIGPNRVEMIPNKASATKSTGAEAYVKPATATRTASISVSFRRRAIIALS